MTRGPRISWLSWLLGAALVATAVTCAPFEPATAPDPKAARAKFIHENVALLDDSTPLMRFDPPMEYLVWFGQIIECTGITPRTFPTFWVASVTSFASRHGALAFYVHSSERIVLGLGYETANWVVRHEMLHHVLAATIPPAPPNESYEEMTARTHPVAYYGGFAPDGTYIAGKCEALVKPPKPGPAPSAPAPGASTGGRS